jgi:hypothetical protein
MKTKAEKNGRQAESCLELKYCERCGGLGLRPVGGGQTYCASCARAMAEMAAGSTEAENVRMPRGRRWDGDDGDLDDDEDNRGLDLDAAGGVA